MRHIRTFKFEYQGHPGDVSKIIAAFMAYLEANANNELDLVISAMPLAAQEKLADIELTNDGDERGVGVQ